MQRIKFRWYIIRALSHKSQTKRRAHSVFGFSKDFLSHVSYSSNYSNPFTRPTSATTHTILHVLNRRVSERSRERRRLLLHSLPLGALCVLKKQLVCSPDVSNCPYHHGCFETQSIGEEQSTQKDPLALSATRRSLRFKEATCLLARRRQLPIPLCMF